jgi:hypothetical protein
MGLTVRWAVRGAHRHGTRSIWGPPSLCAARRCPGRAPHMLCTTMKSHSGTCKSSDGGPGTRGAPSTCHQHADAPHARQHWPDVHEATPAALTPYGRTAGLPTTGCSPGCPSQPVPILKPLFTQEPLSQGALSCRRHASWRHMCREEGGHSSSSVTRQHYRAGVSNQNCAW